MATVTIQVNDATKVGKSLLNIASELASKYKSIHILDKEEKSPYNPKFVKKIRKAEKEKTHVIEDVDTFLNSL